MSRMECGEFIVVQLQTQECGAEKAKGELIVRSSECASMRHFILMILGNEGLRPHDTRERGLFVACEMRPLFFMVESELAHCGGRESVLRTSLKNYLSTHSRKNTLTDTT